MTRQARAMQVLVVATMEMTSMALVAILQVAAGLLNTLITTTTIISHRTIIIHTSHHTMEITRVVEATKETITSEERKMDITMIHTRIGIIVHSNYTRDITIITIMGIIMEAREITVKVIREEITTKAAIVSFIKAMMEAPVDIIRKIIMEEENGVTRSKTIMQEHMVVLVRITIILETITIIMQVEADTIIKVLMSWVLQVARAMESET